ncbi:DUF3298 and DUF4163 domain-containing protein [Hymenobacter glacieicola]|uniref:DUF3298 domain-containing protein n=1 Tax=Hymenobacter glacieicola TaxID=1562124 RepID=A0ABQ1X233_9BACT|nr:DUF3298 and DUF4163 domain-containing protein [Hymenobacter glacieicola]GGG56086.1 hypothetical protein GCM10011378_35350 [Hymenobacter glacieicola]
MNLSFVSCQQAPVRLLLSAAATLALLLSGCNSSPDTSAAQSATAKAPVAASGAQLTDSPGTWYWQYRSVLPGSPDSITLHLQCLPEGLGEASPGRLVGFYTAADGHPYEVMGNLSAGTDSLILRDVRTDAVAQQQNGPRWLLALHGSNLLGTRAGKAMVLRRVHVPAGIELVSRSFTATVPARPNHPQDTIAGRVGLHALLPAGEGSKATLQANLLRTLRGDSLATRPAPTLDAFWKEQLSSFTKDYQQEAGPMLTELDEDTSSYRPLATLRYEQQTSTYVLWNEGSLLSIGYFNYDYSGGAHGNYGTTVCSYDTRTGRVLRYPDIFRAGSEAQLEQLLGRYARPVLGLQPEQPLSDALFENTLPVTRNVYLTSGGAVFVYSPYEVASFAQGEIRVFVPVSGLRPLLKPDLPLAGGAEVVQK